MHNRISVAAQCRGKLPFATIMRFQRFGLYRKARKARKARKVGLAVDDNIFLRSFTILFGVEVCAKLMLNSIKRGCFGGSTGLRLCHG